MLIPLDSIQFVSQDAGLDVLRFSTRPGVRDMSLERIEMRDRLIYSLGCMFAQAKHYLFQEPYSALSRPDHLRLTTNLQNDMTQWSKDLSAFAHFHGLYYDSEYIRAMNYLKNAANCALTLQQDNPINVRAARTDFNTYLDAILQTLRQFPIEVPDFIVPAGSPFQVYRILRPLCANASGRIELFDAYLDANVFHRYFADLYPHADLRVITDQTIMHAGDKKSKAMRDRILAVSELMARERPDRYWFLVVPSLHDRHLRLDDKIFHLGGSAKDAAVGDPFTIGQLDASNATGTVLDGFISSAFGWYQPGLARHRRWCPTCNQAVDVTANLACTVCNNPT